MRRSLGASVLALVAVSSTVLPASTEPASSATGSRAPTGDPWPLVLDFDDVPSSHPFHDDIDWLAGHGIARGFSDDTFRPTRTLDRQTLAAFLARYDGHRLGRITPCTSKPFPDVPVTHPFCAEIKWMEAHELAAGYSDGTLRPGTAVSRQAFAAILHRFEGNDPSDPTCPPAPFTDVPSSSLFCEDIAWLTDHGIASGYPGNRFRPNESLSRQAVAAFLHRYDTTLGHGIPYDFDGDGRADLGWIDDDGNWVRNGESKPFFVGPRSWEATAGDYDGHGTWEPTGLSWPHPGTDADWITTGARGSFSFAAPVSAYESCFQIPMAADFDGDGDSDAAWFDAWDATWHIEGHDDPLSYGIGEETGGEGWCDAPVPADYDGDGDDDLAVYRPGDGTFHVQGMGMVADLGWGYPAAGDYDGDGDDDGAVVTVDDPEWEFADHSTLGIAVLGDDWAFPVPADYDGDGDDDPVVLTSETAQFLGPGIDVMPPPTVTEVGALTLPPSLLFNIIRLTFTAHQCLDPEDPDPHCS